MSILIAVDGGERDLAVVSVGTNLAEAYNDDLVALHVVTDREFKTRKNSVDNYYKDEAVDDAASKAQNILEEILDVQNLHMEEGLSAKGAVGDPAIEILEAVTKLDARHVVIGGRKRSPVGKAIFGSVTQSVLLEADRPVTTVTETADEQ